MRIDDIDIKEMGYILLKGMDDLIAPPTISIYAPIPGRPSLRQSEKLENRQITVPIGFMGATEKELKNKTDYLASLFYKNGKAKRVKIQFDFDNYAMYGHIDGEIFAARENNYRSVEITLILEPFRYEEKVALSITNFPFVLNTQEWMHPTPPVFTFEFSESTFDFRITHLGQDRYVRLIDQNFESGDTLTLDMKDESIFLNSQRINSKLTFESDFFMLESGENEINVNTEGELTVEYAPRYL